MLASTRGASGTPPPYRAVSHKNYQEGRAAYGKSPDRFGGE